MSVPIRGLVVSVGPWYAATLDICLWQNMRHLTECLVVTAPGDPAIEVARAVPDVQVFETSAFFEYNASFNKGYAVELALDQLGRHGWLFIWDADIILPRAFPLGRLDPAKIHGARRRTIDDPAAWHPGFDWNKAELTSDVGPIGFAQLFHADSPALAGKHPWYEVTFPHAAGGDAYFLEHWAHQDRVVLPVECLHLGPKDRHWYGTDPDAVATMTEFVARGFLGSDRVEVPGYPATGYVWPPWTKTDKPRAGQRAGRQKSR